LAAKDGVQCFLDNRNQLMRCAWFGRNEAPKIMGDMTSACKNNANDICFSDPETQAQPYTVHFNGKSPPYIDVSQQMFSFMKLSLRNPVPFDSKQEIIPDKSSALVSKMPLSVLTGKLKVAQRVEGSETDWKMELVSFLDLCGVCDFRSEWTHSWRDICHHVS
jgi:hypothetical protein